MPAASVRDWNRSMTGYRKLLPAHGGFNTAAAANPFALLFFSSGDEVPVKRLRFGIDFCSLIITTRVSVDG